MKKLNTFLGLLAVAAVTSLSAQAQLTGSGTQSDPYVISTAEAWNTFASYVSSTPNDMTGAYVSLTADIDFTGVSDGITPIGGDGTTAFNGTFEGNNHTVSGYSYTSTAAGQGALFGTIDSAAVVSNLTAAGSVTGGTNLTYVAGIVGNLYGTLKNVTHAGSVTATGNYCAGVAAYVYGSAVLEDVTNTGTVTSEDAYVGGIAANVFVSGATFNRCVNKGALTSTKGGSYTDYLGGITAYSKAATYNQCVNDGTISGAGAAGIVAYCVGESGGPVYTFYECVNNGTITGNAYLGGITGAQGSTAGNNPCNYVRCINNGALTTTSTSALSSVGTGGIAGAYSAGSTFDHCVNYGEITSNGTTNTAGIAGYYKGTNASYPVTFLGCENYGKISSQGQQTAGIMAYVSNNTAIDSCYNYGDIETTINGAAGICFYYSGANSSMTNCINYGDVTVGTYYAGGIIGNNGQLNSVLKGCINLGNISSTSTDASTSYGIGGIAGRTYVNVTDCFNAGKITGKTRIGGIVGSPSYNANNVRTRVTSCVNVGEVSADEGCGGPIVGDDINGTTVYWGSNNSCTDTYYLNDQSWRGSGAAVGDNDSIGTGITVAQLAGFDNGTSWYTADSYSFPVPVIGKDDPAVLTNAAAIVLVGEDTYDNVTNNQFYAGNPTGTSWTPSSSIVVVSGNDVTVSETSQIEVTLTNATASAQQAPGTKAYSGADGVDWILKLNVDALSGIDDTTLGKVVAQEAYYTLNGVLIEQPAESDGQVYIVVRKYTDGTIGAVKIRN